MNTSEQLLPLVSMALNKVLAILPESEEAFSEKFGFIS